MIRWAMCGLIVLLAGAVVGVRAENCGWYQGRQAVELKPAGGSGGADTDR